MSHNFYIPNWLPVQRGISEITNISVPLNVLSFQSIPIQFNTLPEGQKLSYNDFPECYSNLQKWANESQNTPLNLESQKENENFELAKLLASNHLRKVSPKSTEAWGSENVYTSSKEDPSHDIKKKEKSLSELTKNFMKRYGSKNDIVIPLDKCTTHLNTEKRRVYDIMNIFEGFGAVSRKAKNLYSWKGLSQISIALDNIYLRWNEIIEDKFLKESALDEKTIDTALSKYKFERVKSLGFLWEAFIWLFILWKPIISLEEAAKKISTILLNESQLKTKVRRLYDIANVLWVLKIVKKTLLKTGKPAFQWIGRSGIEEFSLSIGEKILSDEDSTQKEANSAISIETAQNIPEKREDSPSAFTRTVPSSKILNSINVDSLVNNLPLGLNEQSLDLLEGIVRVLRRRLQDEKQSTK